MSILGRASSGLRTYLPVPTDCIDTRRLAFDLYLKPPDGGSPALYRSAGLPFLREHRERLSGQGVRFLYVPATQSAPLTSIVASNIDRIQQDDSVSPAMKREIIGGVCAWLIEDAMTSTTPGALSPLFEIGATLAASATGDDAPLSCLLDMSGHDFGTSIHMMNVGIGCGLLARRLHPDRPEFVRDLINGGLVHDLGKAAVPKEILNKDGQLTDEEFAAIREHPLEGVRRLGILGVTNATVLEATRDHHEHLSGAGYPGGLAGDELGEAARITAVVDVYDAITAARPYRAAIAWDEALGMLERHRGSQFDPRVLDAWGVVVTEAAREHAEELPKDTAPPCDLSEALGPEAGAIPAPAEREPASPSGEPPKRACRLSATIAPIGASSSGRGQIPATILELSEGRVRFGARETLDVGDAVSLRTSTSGSIPVNLIATIRERHRPRPGADGWIYTAEVRSARSRVA